MPYLPEDYLHDTLFPEAFDEDVRTQIRLIDEQAARFFPAITYYCALRTVGIAVTDTVTGGPAPVGATGQNTFDPLWGEIVDPTLAGQPWEQPHLHPTLQAGTEEIERYGAPVQVRARIQREVKDYELKRYGFDEMRDILVHIPVATLDRLGLTVFPGDKFVWDGDEFTVKQDRGSGWWKNSNIRLWRTLMGEHKKRGA